MLSMLATTERKPKPPVYDNIFIFYETVTNWLNNLITNELQNILAAGFILGTVLRHILSLVIFCTNIFIHEVKGFVHGKTGQHHLLLL